MERTLIAVHNTLAAIHTPAYDVGILTDRGMLPGLANLSAANVLSRIPLLRAHNAKGAHIYIRPSGEHRFTVLDDLSQQSVDRLAADGYEPCAVVETSPGNFQAWLKHDDVYPAHLSTFVARDPRPAISGRSERGGLAAIRPSPRFHQLQAEISPEQRPLSLRAPETLDAGAAQHGLLSATRNDEALSA